MPWQHISIIKLELTNFKSFYGHHSLELSTQRDKPLILIGGQNMRGKTSIHEAINYCLFEDDDLPGIQTRPSYLRAVSERLNRTALDDGKTDYKVALELRAKGKGIDADRLLRIERTWEVNVPDRRVVDIELKIYENERPIDWMDELSYQEFLRSLLPPKIAPFFIFDGERIQEFAEEDSGRRMVEAIEDILHINVFKLLRKDLKDCVIDHIEKHEVKETHQDDFFELQGDKERIENELEEKREFLSHLIHNTTVGA
jgi:DNA sulfur modification protein DndD